MNRFNYKNKNFLFEMLTILVISFYILSQYFPPFIYLDNLHIKHYILIAYFVFSFLRMIINHKCLYFDRNLRLMFFLVLILGSISFVRQAYINSFGVYTFLEFYFLLSPLILVLIVFNNKLNFSLIFGDIFIISTFCLLYNTINSNTLNINNVISSFNILYTLLYSKTPFETNLAQIFLICCFYYFSNKKYIFGILSAFFVIFCAKRFSIIFLLLLIPFFVFIKIRKKFKKNLVPSNFLLFVSCFIFISSPIIIYNLYLSPDFSNLFYSKTGLILNDFTMDRTNIFSIAIQNGTFFGGFGGVTNYLESIEDGLNLHNDLMMIYMDCGFLGILSFVCFFFIFSRNNYYSYFMTVYFMCEFLSAHFLGRGGFIYLLSYFLIMYYFNSKFIYRSHNVNLLHFRLKSLVRGNLSNYE